MDMANSCPNCTSTTKSIFTAVDLKLKMDALVSDLTHALDESQLSQYHRKRKGIKRRPKLTNSISNSFCTRIGSGDSSSSLGELTLSQDKSSLPLTDSDDLSPPLDPKLRIPHLIHHKVPPNLAESDSVNENFAPARLHNRRKQKGKRIALDSNTPSTSSNCISVDRPFFHNSFRKRKNIRTDADNKFGDISLGKRKRCRDRTMDWDNPRRCTHRTRRHSSSHCSNVKHPSSQQSHSGNGDFMEMEYSNESNISSSESEAGIYTCDEGREADDEQSDWFAEPGTVYGVPGAESTSRDYSIGNERMDWWNEENISLSPSTRDLFKEKYDKMSQESQQACRLRFQKLRERLMNPIQSELRLKPMSETDRDQLKHLANLYSLSVLSGDDQSAPVLTKTRNTITAKQLDAFHSMNESNFPGVVPVPMSDLKRRRRTPPLSVNLTGGSNDSIDSIVINSGPSPRPPVPTASWGDDDIGECCADSLSERLADSEPDPVPSPTSLGLKDCTL